MPWESRAAIFLKAANLVSGPYRAKINAATMIAQSKTIYQAETDAACEFIDFLRFNVQFMREIYEKQPENTLEIWNRLEYRPLEGFVYAISPFNFTAIAGNLPASAALMGNVVIWKPSDYQIFSAKMAVYDDKGKPHNLSDDQALHQFVSWDEFKDTASDINNIQDIVFDEPSITINRQSILTARAIIYYHMRYPQMYMENIEKRLKETKIPGWDPQKNVDGCVAVL